jgi:hypothetical protein
MTPEELQEGWHWAQHQFYSYGNILKRTWGTGASFRINLATSIQYNWFTKLRFPRGYNPARNAPPPAGPRPLASLRAGDRVSLVQLGGEPR